MRISEKDKRGLILNWARERGVVRPRDILALNASPTYLRRLVEEGHMRRVSRGLYTLANYEATEAHTLVEAVNSQSKAVVCLLSALSFYGIGTQIPFQVWLAIPYGTRISKREYPPRQIVVMRPSSYEAGVELHSIEGIDVPIYNIAKTVADCFKFRNKIGLDVAIEALREVLAERRCGREEIRHYAWTNRVENVMRPYMEAMA